MDQQNPIRPTRGKARGRPQLPPNYQAPKGPSFQGPPVQGPQSSIQSTVVPQQPIRVPQPIQSTVPPPTQPIRQPGPSMQRPTRPTAVATQRVPRPLLEQKSVRNLNSELFNKIIHLKYFIL